MSLEYQSKSNRALPFRDFRTQVMVDHDFVEGFVSCASIFKSNVGSSHRKLVDKIRRWALGSPLETGRSLKGTDHVGRKY